MDRLQEIEDEITRLETRIHLLASERDGLKRKRANIDFGDVVEDKNGNAFRVTKIELWPQDKPWVSGNPQKKDGTWGTSQRNLYGHWTKL